MNGVAIILVTVLYVIPLLMMSYVVWKWHSYQYHFVGTVSISVFEFLAYTLLVIAPIINMFSFLMPLVLADSDFAKEHGLTSRNFFPSMSITFRKELK